MHPESDSLRLEEVCRQVALARIGKYCGDGLAASRAPRNFERSATVRAGGNSHQYPLLAREPARIQRRLLVTYGNYLVVNTTVEVFRNESCADSLDLVEPGLAAREDRRALRFDRDDQHLVLQMVAQIPADAAYRAAGAYARDERVDSVELPDQLGAGGVVMDLRVGRIAE